ncbi:AAA family ATPase [Streptomyces sp. NPDC005776]|uniref:AAA family ATPase n=1 Tax=Streptomyces sp. NPDC005776 TaxID=3154676 RepID=UPI0033CA1061
MRIHIRHDPPLNNTGTPRWLTLHYNNWDDFHYRTTFDAYYRQNDLTLVYLGRVRIARADQAPGPSPLPEGFLGIGLSELGEDWFSLGQDPVYYDTIRRLGNRTRSEILTALQDIAFLPDIFERVHNLTVTETSLLRGIEKRTVRTQFKRIAHGGAMLKNYEFNINPPSDVFPNSEPLDFSVDPNSNPQSNIHALIGRNGSGKTTLLWQIARSFIAQTGAVRGTAVIEPLNHPIAGERGFTNLVVVTFSAFDRSAMAPQSGNGQYHYIGLADETGLGAKSAATLEEEFSASLVEVSATTDRLRALSESLKALASDPNFSESPILDLVHELTVETFTEDMVRNQGGAIFSALSSGHAIAVLTLTRLVELTAEESLVLFDEPEAHLHPPLLSAFMRAVSGLMTERNAVAIMATHSPVVLQEVPRSCVWKLNRLEGFLHTERPAIETFGENVGVLTHEVFGLEARKAGFHAEIEKAVTDLDTYEAVLNHFNGQLGGEAKGLVRILLAQRNARESD